MNESLLMNRSSRISLPVILFLTLLPLTLLSQERSEIRLRDFASEEVKTTGMILPQDTRIHIRALGAGSRENSSENGLVAYCWIIDAVTRERVWVMDWDNTTRTGNDRSFDDQIDLHKGRYEVYFAAYAFISKTFFSEFTINIDRRERSIFEGYRNKRWLFPWIEDFFGKDIDKAWRQRSAKWGVDLTVEGNGRIKTFTPPLEFSNVLVRMTGIGENEHRTQRFLLDQPAMIRIYALGEMTEASGPVDFAWILDAKTRRRFWEMGRASLGHAGGARKNVKFDQTVNFPAGDYIIYYASDGSHSSLDWNSAPPEDPLNYGITLCATDPTTKAHIKLSSALPDENVVLQLTRVGDDETRSGTFTLKSETSLRVYALGERQPSRREMTDFGWIMNAKTREKVWTMDVNRTEHAGGSEKNRLIDEVITLPKGTYTVFFQTDDSHAFGDWNSAPPFDPEHWGITIYGAGGEFNKGNVEVGDAPLDADIITQLTRMGDNENRTQLFTLSKPTRVRIYALGEGQNREMYDYGWIERTDTHERVWEMTYSMTFHGGGGRKNRVGNTTILLDKGSYELHYTSDDSHSYNHWNTDPPDDPTMWGITLYLDQDK